MEKTYSAREGRYQQIEVRRERLMADILRDEKENQHNDYDYL